MVNIPLSAKICDRPGNPPFGRIHRSSNAPRYRGSEFELHVIDIAGEIADYGTFIISQQRASFRVSGRPYYERRTNGRGVDYEQLTGFEMAAGVGVDTAFFKDQWKDTSIICEIACFDFAAARERRAQERERIMSRNVAATERAAEQLAFF